MTDTDPAAPQVYNELSFTEVSSMSDLKSVPSNSAIGTGTNSPLQSESEPENPCPQKRSWPKYKKFRDPETGDEAIYELVSTSSCPRPSSKYPQKGIFALCNDLVTLSSISLFVASNLFAFTVGMFVGKRLAYDL